MGSQPRAKGSQKVTTNDPQREYQEWNADIHFARIDVTVLPLLFLGLLVFQLDRMNIASALTGGFAADINISQSTINLGNQLMFMGIVVFEIPCNMALQRVCTRLLLWRYDSNKNFDRLVLASGFRLRFFSSACLLPCKYLFAIEDLS